ncbi:ester cyclase [Rubellicoccus peritrichatus]|uniref:Ester cyclase n=1 Tax=Rubellicoccus peritrichatus TaxID=3080537 RepID=A0AAQ3QXF0_9BACT|nr:ester cyclase [Puniceicoccus sp. CR14]WOO42795.1 ester cyclase [Puniceicoccus sp. CR14]
MNAKTGKELTLEWFERVWHNAEVTAISELMCQHCNVKGLDMDSSGPAGFIPLHSAFCSAFESIRIEVLEMIEEEGVVMGHARFIAVHKATERKVDFVFSFSARWKDGRMSEARNVVDYVAMLSQLGLFDQHSMAKVFG